MADEGFIKAKNYALKLLSFRPRSIQEISYKLRNYLIKKNLSPDLEEKVVTSLTSLNLLNDEDFAAWWLMQRKNASIRGNKIIKMELRSKGVAQDVIDQVLKNENQDAEIAKAQILVKKKLTKMPKQKLQKLLLRRGFDFDIIRRAIDESR